MRLLKNLNPGRFDLGTTSIYPIWSIFLFSREIWFKNRHFSDAGGNKPGTRFLLLDNGLLLLKMFSIFFPNLWKQGPRCHTFVFFFVFSYNTFPFIFCNFTRTAGNEKMRILIVFHTEVVYGLALLFILNNTGN